MSERQDYNIMRKYVVQGKDRMERIENIAGTGTPDVNFCSMGVECWIEMKSSIEPKRATSSLLKSNHKLSQTQKNWFLQQRCAGGRGYIMIATNKRWMLIDSEYADDINKMTIGQLWNAALWGWMRPVTKEQWAGLRTILTEGTG